MQEFNFYIDDSGTRNPDRKPGRSHFGGDWFALGGILVASEDEASIRQRHADFCQRWEITYPLHSVRIRHRSENFAWIGQLEKADQHRFYRELEDLLVGSPIIALACVIHRPGYNARYTPIYGTERWSLCKTAFPIIAERAAKFAVAHDRRVRLYVERSDKASEKLLKGYFDEMRTEGMPFAAGGNPKYQPLDGAVMKSRLYDLQFKRKTSPMVQLADLMLYPLCKGAYDGSYRPYAALRDAGKLIEAHLAEDQRSVGGIKYSCFDGFTTQTQ